MAQGTAGGSGANSLPYEQTQLAPKADFFFPPQGKKKYKKVQQYNITSSASFFPQRTLVLVADPSATKGAPAPDCPALGQGSAARPARCTGERRGARARKGQGVKMGGRKGNRWIQSRFSIIFNGHIDYLNED